MSTLPILTVLLATILAGCGGMGSEGTSQAPKVQQASRTAGFTDPEDEESHGQASVGRLGYPRSKMPMRLWF